ncbi:MAG: LEPR-XLL domain-containing protein, partial [Desulfosudaceae bacterium]
MLRNKKSNQAGAKDKRKKRGADRKERPFQFEALEPRLLLSAELGIPPADPEDLGATPAPVVENVDRFNDVTTTPAGDGLKSGETESLTGTAPEEDL